MKYKPSVSDANRLMLYIIGGFTVFVVGLIVVLSVVSGNRTNTSANITPYKIDDQDRPKATISSKFADLGNVEVNEQQKTDFTIENTGSKPLILSNISSSCGCTVGQITIGESKSPELDMHSKSSWQGTLNPSEKATLTVIYRPYIMPVSGIITRDVYVKTNDPENELITFTVKADVK